MNTNLGPAITSTFNSVAIYTTQSFPPASNDTPGIQAAITTAFIAGGGVVPLGAAVYNITKPIVPLPGVAIRGVVPSINYGSNPNTIPDSWLVAPQRGTIFNCNGGDGFAWNLDALATPASQLAFTLTGLTGIEISGIGFTNFRNGINAGATNNLAALYSKFLDLYGQAGTGWLINMTNFQHCTFERLRSFGCLTGQMFWGNDVPAATLQPGNSTFEDLFAVTGSGSNLIRGICHNVNQGTQNQATHSRIQSNKLNASTVTQAATMVNLSANITITDGTKFAVNVPVSFTTTANGFTANKIYFVLSVAANVVTVSLTVGGAAVTATGNTAINMVTQGFAPLELIALSGCNFTNQTMMNIDVEGGGTAAIVMQNKSGMWLNISQLPLTSQATQGVCCRNVLNSVIVSPNGTNTDFDNSASQAIQYYGTRAGNCVGTMGVGMWTDSVTGNIVQSLGAAFDTQSKGALYFQPSTNNQLTGNAISVLPTTNGNAGPTLSLVAGITTFTTGGTTITLPVVSATSAGQICITNTAVGTQTIATNGTQLFNGIAGRTTLTLPIGASVYLACAAFSGGLFGYAVLGASGAIIAGAVTAPT